MYLSWEGPVLRIGVDNRGALPSSGATLRSDPHLPVVYDAFRRGRHGVVGPNLSHRVMQHTARMCTMKYQIR